ncbi:MAG: DinB family protein [Caldilineaceae bacterium]|nr:DinB family protein [Caldilineaceae bacterium]
MNADAFRHLYNYHFTENRAIWDRYIAQLSDKQFTEPVDYSIGAVRDQILHLISADDTWFRSLSGHEFVDWLKPADFPDRASIRAHWDTVEQAMRDYLAALRDEMLLSKPIAEPEEDRDLMLWQVLLHVVNHGTDHRAQLLRMINDFGVKTASQDYIFYVYDHLGES